MDHEWSGVFILAMRRAGNDEVCPESSFLLCFRRVLSWKPKPDMLLARSSAWSAFRPYAPNRTPRLANFDPNIPFFVWIFARVIEMGFKMLL